MIPVNEFQQENIEIKDLCTVLHNSVENYELMGNTIICELLDRLIDRVNAHLTHEDRSIYRDLLKKHTREADLLADHFLGNTQELKKIFNSYSRDWCSKPHSEKKHDEFVKESQDIFRMVCDRIHFEEEKIFPFFVENKI